MTEFPSIRRNRAVTPTRRFHIPVVSNLFTLISYAAAFPAWVAWRLYNGSYTSPVTHNRCSNTASFRAIPTSARRFARLPPPPHLLIPQARRSLSGAPFRKLQCAACTK
jgi:hypothetical protein